MFKNLFIFSSGLAIGTVATAVITTTLAFVIPLAVSDEEFDELTDIFRRHRDAMD